MSALREAVRLNPDDLDGRSARRRPRSRPAISTARGRISIARRQATIRRCCSRSLNRAAQSGGSTRRARDPVRGSCGRSRESCARRSSNSPGRWRRLSRGRVRLHRRGGGRGGSSRALRLTRPPSCRSSSPRGPARWARCLKLVEVCVDGGLEATMYERRRSWPTPISSAGKATRRG